MLYHYTDRDSAADARKSGVLRAHPVLVRTALIGGEEVALSPAAWFTAAETPSPTVLAKMAVGGWPLDRPGMVWRFAVADDAAPLALDEWGYSHRHHAELFRWMLVTAKLAGEDWTQWRLSDVDVPGSAWLAVQSLHGEVWRDE